MPDFRMKLDSEDAYHLRNYAAQQGTDMSKAVRGLIYRFAYPDVVKRDTYDCYLKIDADTARMIDNIMTHYNHQRDLTVHGVGGLKFGDTVNLLLRRAIKNMLDTNDRNPYFDGQDPYRDP